MEVLMFGRDANMAEAWLSSQEPILRSTELGGNVDEVENLIKRHEGFQKLAAAWEERFLALEKLTTVGGARDTERAVGGKLWLLADWRELGEMLTMVPRHATLRPSSCVTFCSVLGMYRLPFPQKGIQCSFLSELLLSHLVAVSSII